MKITLNGQFKEFNQISNLETLVEQFCKEKTPVIAELNGEIIKDLHWEKTALKEGDRVELVSFVGGGSVVARDSLLVASCLSFDIINFRNRYNHKQPATSNQQRQS